MPTRPASPCSFPLCPMASVSHGRCAQHQREDRQRFDQHRGTAAQRGYDAEWKRVRAWHLHDNPWCVTCLGEGRHVLATDVDHQPRYVPGTDHHAYLLTSYCHAHHSARTSRQVR